MLQELDIKYSFFSRSPKHSATHRFFHKIKDASHHSSCLYCSWSQEAFLKWQERVDIFYTPLFLKIAIIYFPCLLFISYIDSNILLEWTVFDLNFLELVLQNLLDLFKICLLCQVPPPHPFVLLVFSRPSLLFCFLLPQMTWDCWEPGIRTLPGWLGRKCGGQSDAQNLSRSWRHSLILTPTYKIPPI